LPTSGSRFEEKALSQAAMDLVHEINPKAEATAVDCTELHRRPCDEHQGHGGLSTLTGSLHTRQHTFCAHLWMRGAQVMAVKEPKGHRRISTTVGLHAPESSGERERNSPAGWQQAGKEHGQPLSER
jgi:hypothetical protein